MKVKSKVLESVIPVNLPLTEQKSTLMPNIISLVCVVGSQGPAFHATKLTSHLLHSVHLLSSLSKRLSYRFPDDAETCISIAFAYGYDIHICIFKCFHLILFFSHVWDRD